MPLFLFPQLCLFIIDFERGPPFLGGTRPPCQASRASHGEQCLMMSYWSHKQVWNCVGVQDCLRMRHRVHVLWHCRWNHVYLKIWNQTKQMGPSKASDVILQNSIQQIFHKQELPVWKPQKLLTGKTEAAQGQGTLPEHSRNFQKLLLGHIKLMKTPWKYFLYFNKIMCPSCKRALLGLLGRQRWDWPCHCFRRLSLCVCVCEERQLRCLCWS